MKTIENNKIIAEFLNWEFDDLSETFETPFLKLVEPQAFGDEQFSCKLQDFELEFHSDWNWLMEVVEKIESLEIFDRMGRFNINTKNFDENYTSFITDKDEDFIQCEGETKIEAVYSAVVEFIKWYNNQNKVS